MIWWETAWTGGEMEWKMERYILFLPSLATSSHPPKWICLQDHLSPSSLRLLPVHRFLRSPVVCWHVLTFSSTRHRSPPTRWRRGCGGGKTAKFMVPIKNQNICSTTSSVRFSWIKFGLRQRSWQHQHSDYISPSPAAMIYVHFIEKHTIHSQLRSNDHPLLFRPKKPHTPL